MTKLGTLHGKGAATEAGLTYGKALQSESTIQGALRCCLLVFACFTLTSEAWIGWLYHLLTHVDSQSADALTMVGGYFCQALGIAVTAVCVRYRPTLAQRTTFAAAVGLHFVFAMLALSAADLGGTLIWGYLMSVCCGIIAAFYLTKLAQYVPKTKKGLAFGCGYACSIVATWLLSFAQGEFDLTFGFPVCAVLAIGLAWGTTSPAKDANAQGATPQNASAKQAQPEAGKPATAAANWKLISLGCATVVLMSLVKNLGFGFPSIDLSNGVSMEFSRLFYAAGLVIAGFVTDRSRHYGALCCMAALVTPFALMALSGEPVPGLILWAVDYFFYGFFSVFRVVLFADIATREDCLWLAGFGLMAGRIGDALGTATRLALSDSIIVLVIIAACAFMATIIVFYLLSQQLNLLGGAQEPAPSTEQTPDSKELAFERLSTRYELSTREREVLRAVLDDKTNAQIASELFVQESTVKFHMRNLLKKTECANRKDLRAAYLAELELLSS